MKIDLEWKTSIGSARGGGKRTKEIYGKGKRGKTMSVGITGSALVCKKIHPMKNEKGKGAEEGETYNPGGYC